MTAAKTMNVFTRLFVIIVPPRGGKLPAEPRACELLRDVPDAARVLRAAQRAGEALRRGRPAEVARAPRAEHPAVRIVRGRGEKRRLRPALDAAEEPGPRGRDDEAE